MILITIFESLKMRNTFFKMKSRTFLLLLIGMISITSMASTPLMEQKQKATTQHNNTTTQQFCYQDIQKKKKRIFKIEIV